MSCRSAISKDQGPRTKDRPPHDLFIFVNGILTLPSDKNGWTDRACRWIDEELEWLNVEADALEYFTGPTLMWRTLKNREMVRALVKKTEALTTKGHEGTRIHLVGHSNGCDIICSALPAIRAKVRSITLIGAAVEHRFDRNNLNEALFLRPELTVQILCSRGDAVLKWLARPSRWLTGRLGYGYLGYQAALGRQHLRIGGAFEDRVTVVSYHSTGHGEFKPPGHSEYFAPEMFENTMRRVVANAGISAS